jgi:hypothetical protein
MLSVIKFTTSPHNLYLAPLCYETTGTENDGDRGTENDGDKKTTGTEHFIK